MIIKFYVSLVFLFSVNCRKLPRGARKSAIVVGHTLHPSSKIDGAPLLPPCTEDYDTDYDIASIGGRNENIPGVNCDIQQAQDKESSPPSRGVVVGHTLNPSSNSGVALCYQTTKKRWGRCPRAPPMMIPLPSNTNGRPSQPVPPSTSSKCDKCGPNALCVYFYTKDEIWDIECKCPRGLSGNPLEQCYNNSLQDMNSGLWKPDGAKGECGKKVDVDDLIRTKRDSSHICRFTLEGIPVLCNPKVEFIIRPVEPVIDGRASVIGKFPWMALLGYNPPNISGNEIYYLCGGSVINKRYVLTAAHCIDTRNGFPVEVVLGENVVNRHRDCSGCPPVIKRKLKKDKDFIVHEDYVNVISGNDIALIRIDEAIPLHREDPTRSLISPICLPWSRSVTSAWDLKDGHKSTVAGWGRITNNLAINDADLLKYKVSVQELQFLELPIANGKCGPRNLLKINPAVQICAGGETGKDSCNGDSGGPLMAYENDTAYEVGIVSYGTPKRCGQGAPGVYTKVTNYLPWIESKLQQ